MSNFFLPNTTSNQWSGQPAVLLPPSPRFSSSTLLAIPLLSFIVIYVSALRRRSKPYSNKYPPVVEISPADMFTRPQEAYEAALEQHGPVVGVWRKGRLEYIVNQEHTKHVFSDDRALSFEQGVATILNLRFVLAIKGGKFFKDLDKLVANGITPRMENVVDKIFPIFLKHAKNLMAESSKNGPAEGVDLFAHAHRSIAEAMLTLVLGEAYINEKNLEVVEDVAHNIALLTGIYQNTSWFARTFPAVWRIATWTRVIFGTIIFKYFRVLGPCIWRELRNNVFVPLDQTNDQDDGEGILVHYMARMYAQEDGRVPVTGVLWVSCLILSFIFASVHQTAAVVVWIMFELASRPSYLPAIREELSAILEPGPDGTDKLSYESLRNAQHLDSFIREVLRLKGDTLSVTRQTLQDVSIGGYVIPKGHLVIPLTTLSHKSREIHGENALTFDGFRYVDKGQPASMVSLGYFPFGLNRWACPGRILAVAEIKMIVLTLLGVASPGLKGGKYVVTDPLNATSVPPSGRLLLSNLDVPILRN